MTTPHSQPPSPRSDPEIGSAAANDEDLVAQLDRYLSLLHAGDDALYLEVQGDCLGVLGARAVQVPCGVRTRLPHLPEIEVGAPVEVVDGTIALDGIDAPDPDVLSC